ncbi:hypothetical protein ABPG74_011842 [Tetrahymena malaccensis]
MSEASTFLENAKKAQKISNKKEPTYVQGLFKKLTTINKVQNKQNQSQLTSFNRCQQQNLQKNQEATQQNDTFSSKFQESPIKIEDQNIQQMHGNNKNEQIILQNYDQHQAEAIQLPKDCQIPLEYLKKVQHLIAKYNKLHQSSKIQNSILEQMIQQRQPSSDTVSKFLFEKYQNGKNLQEFEKDYQSIQKLVELLERKILVLDKAYLKKRQNEVQYKLTMQKLQEEIQLLQNICVQMINMRIAQLHPFQRESRKQTLQDNKQLEKEADDTNKNGNDKRSYSVDGDLYESSEAAQNNLKQQLKINRSFDKKMQQDRQNFVSDLSQAEGLISNILSMSQISYVNDNKNQQREGQQLDCFQKNQNVDQTLDELSEIQQDIKDSQKALMSQDINETIQSYSINLQEIQTILKECSGKLKYLKETNVLDNQQIAKILTQAFYEFFKVEQLQSQKEKGDTDDQQIRSLPNLESKNTDNQTGKITQCDHLKPLKSCCQFQGLKIEGIQQFPSSFYQEILEKQIAEFDIIKKYEIQNILDQQDKQNRLYQQQIIQQDQKIKQQEQQIMQLKEQCSKLENSLNQEKLKYQEFKKNMYQIKGQQIYILDNPQDITKDEVSQNDVANDKISSVLMEEEIKKLVGIKEKEIEDMQAAQLEQYKIQIRDDNQKEVENLSNQYKKQIGMLEKIIKDLNENQQIIQDKFIEEQNKNQKLEMKLKEDKQIALQILKDEHKLQTDNMVQQISSLSEELRMNQEKIKEHKINHSEITMNLEKDILKQQEFQIEKLKNQNNLQEQRINQVSEEYKSIVNQLNKELEVLQLQYDKLNTELQNEQANHLRQIQQFEFKIEELNVKNKNHQIDFEQEMQKQIKIQQKLLQENEKLQKINSQNIESVDFLNQEITQLKESNQKIENELKQQANDYLRNCQLLQKQLTELQQNESLKNEKINKFQQEINDLNMKINLFISQEEQQKQQIDQKIQENSKLQKDLDKLKQQNQQQKEQIENLQRTAVEQIQIIQTLKEQECEQKIQEMITENEDLLKQTNTLKQCQYENAQLQSQLENIKNQTSQFQQSKALLEQEIENLKLNITKISKDNMDQKKLIESLQEQVKIAEQQKNQHQRQIDLQQKALVQSEKEIVNQKMIVNELKAQIQDQENKKLSLLKQLENEHKIMIDQQNDASNQKKIISELKQQTSTLENQNQQLQKQIGEDCALQSDIIIFLKEKSNYLIETENTFNHKIIDSINTFYTLIEGLILENKSKVEHLASIQQKSQDNLFSIDSSQLLRKLDGIQSETLKLKKKNQKNLQIKEFKSYFERLQKLVENEENLNKTYFKEITVEQQELSLKLVKLQHDIEIEVFKIQNQTLEKVDKIQKKIFPGGLTDQAQFENLNANLNSILSKFENEFKQITAQAQGTYWDYGKENRLLERKLIDIYEEVKKMREGQFSMKMQLRKKEMQDFDSFNQISKNLVNQLNKFQTIIEGLHVTQFSPVRSSYNIDMFNQNNDGDVMRSSSNPLIKNGNQISLFGSRKSQIYQQKFEKVDEKQENEENAISEIEDDDEDFKKFQENLTEESDQSKIQSKEITSLQNLSSLQSLQKKKEDQRISSASAIALAFQNEGGPSSNTSLGKISPLRESMTKQLNIQYKIQLNNKILKTSFDGMRQSVSRIENEDQRNIRFILEELKKIKQNVEKVVNSLLQYNFEEIQIKTLKQTIETLETELTEYKNYYQQSVGYIQGVFDELQQIGDPVYQFSQLNTIFKQCCTDLQDFYKKQLQSQDRGEQNYVIEVIQQVKQLGQIVNDNLNKQIQEIVK